MGRKVKAIQPEARTPEFEIGKYPAPSVLQGLALEVWNETIPELEKAGISNRVEANALACYCQSVADFNLAQAEVDRLGLVVQTERGYTKNPAVTIKAGAMDKILRFAIQFGLTPMSRSKIKMKDQPEENEFDPANI
jgi:P27 family predicted phage terminase small subunit